MSTEQLEAQKTEAESFAWYKRVWDLLDEYKQKQFTATIFHGKRKEYTGIEVYSSRLSMDEHIDYIKSLLAGKGYSVRGNKNTETITIK